MLRIEEMPVKTKEMRQKKKNSEAPKMHNRYKQGIKIYGERVFGVEVLPL